MTACVIPCWHFTWEMSWIYFHGQGWARLKSAWGQWLECFDSTEWNRYYSIASAKLLTSLTAEWFGVIWGITRVERGSALLLVDGWPPVWLASWHLSGLGAVASNRLWSEEWIDFRGIGQVVTRHKSAWGTEAGMLWFNCMESIVLDCPEYSVMTLYLPQTHIC